MNPTAAKPERMEQANGRIPPLVHGDRLTREEFERRYEAMSHVHKAELLDGVVYMPSPVNQRRHGRPHFRLIGWLATYETATPGVEGGDNSTVRMDEASEPQPDVQMFVLPEFGGQIRFSPEGYIEGSPELAAEVAASSAAVDVRVKLPIYQRNGVREYIIWRVLDSELDWYVLRGGTFELLLPDAAGVIRSQVFPGLWLDVPALLRGDMPAVLAVLQQGLSSPEHAAFVTELARRRDAAPPASGQ